MQSICLHIIECPICYEQSREAIRRLNFNLFEKEYDYVLIVSKLFDLMIETLKNPNFNIYELKFYYDQLLIYCGSFDIGCHDIYSKCFMCQKRNKSKMCWKCRRCYVKKFGTIHLELLKKIIKWMDEHQYLWCIHMFRNREKTINKN